METSPLLIDVAWKATALLALAWAVSWPLSRRSAALRHLLWTLTLVALLLLPAALHLLPRVSLPVLPAEAPPVVAAAPAPEPMPIAPVYEPIEPAPAPAVANARPAPAPAEPWCVNLATLWILGLMLSLAPWMLGRIALARTARHAVPLRDSSLLALADELVARLRVKQHLTLLTAPGAVMPMTWGLFRARILLPQAALDWPDALRRTVLLHELAHVRRRDCLSHAVARLAVSLYWWNPLAWHALRMMRIERERACDDLVLTAGCRATEYANHLLDVAGSLSGARLAGMAALTMARPGQLEGRLLAVLDKSRNRRALTRLALVGTTALALGAVVGISIATLTCASPPKQDAPADWTRTAEGVTLELVAISPQPSDENTWWDPRGLRLAEAPVAIGKDRFTAQGKESFNLAFKVIGATEATPGWSARGDASFAFGGWGTYFDLRTADPADILHVQHLAASPDTERCDLRLGIATAAWTERATLFNDSTFGRSISSSAADGFVDFAPASELNGKAVVVVMHNYKEPQSRLVGVLKDGSEEESNRSNGGGSSEFSQVSYMFTRPLVEYKAFRFETRPYTWIEWKDIPLAPKAGSVPQPAPAPKEETPPSAVAEATAESPAWRERFDEVYRLEPNQVVRHIPTPFIPERRDYVHEKRSWDANASQPRFMTFDWTLYRNHGASSFGPSERYKLSNVLHYALHLELYALEGNALDVEVSGDWIARAAATIEERVAALEKILNEEMQLPIHFQKKMTDREVIVARGEYQLTPVPGLPENEERYVQLYSDELDESSGAGGGSGTVADLLDWTGSRVNRWFIDETQPSDEELSWRNHHSTDISSITQRPERLDLLLENVSVQTGLTFTKETRAVPVWFVVAEE